MIVAKKEDRRVQRTRNMLHEAFVELMIEKGYAAITVQDIIDKANVGRSTFYSHFLDKEQLLSGTIDKLREFLIQQSVNRSLPEIPGEYRFGFSLAMLQHVQSDKVMYKATVGKKGGAFVLQHIQNMIADLARDEIAALLPPSASLPIPQEVAVKFVVNTFLTLLAWWVDKDMPCSAADVDRIFHKLTLSGLNSL